MTTPNIEELMAILLRCNEDGSLAEITENEQKQAANALQSQAERIEHAEIRESKLHKEFNRVDLENQALRAQLAEIAATEPAWFHRVGFHGEHRFYDQTETQPEGCTPLFLAAGAAPTKEQT